MDEGRDEMRRQWMGMVEKWEENRKKWKKRLNELEKKGEELEQKVKRMEAAGENRICSEAGLKKRRKVEGIAERLREMG